MTREEALQILDTIPTIGEQVDALEMAIEALSAEPCDKCVYSTKDSYCQYDDIAETIPSLNHALIAALPSVQPINQNIKALGEELRTFRGGIKDEKVLTGFNMAIALCNKHLADMRGEV